MSFLGSRSPTHATGGAVAECCGTRFRTPTSWACHFGSPASRIRKIIRTMRLPRVMRVTGAMRLAIALLFCLGCSVYGEQSSSQEGGSDFHLDSSDHTTVPTTNGVVFEAMINGKGPFQMIFDTGAGVNILNPAVIAQLGLPAESGAVALPAMGGPVDAKTFRADEVRIGDLALDN